MSYRTLLFSLLLSCLLPSAFAAPSTWLEVTSNEEEVVVLAKGVTFESYKVKTSRQFLLIELEGATIKKDRVPVTDQTIDRIETLGGGSHSRIYLEVKKGAPSPTELVPVVRVEASAEGLLIFVPRSIVTKPQPVAAMPEPVMVTPKLMQPVAPPTSAPVMASPTPKAAPVQPLASLPQPQSSNNLWIFSVLLLGAVGALAWAKKRQPNAPNDPRFTILASRPLDAKNKLVLLSAGKKEMLLSVSDNGARLIESWKKEKSEEAEPFKFEEVVRQEIARAPQLVEEPKPLHKTMRKDGINKNSNEYWSMEEIPKVDSTLPKPQPQSASAEEPQSAAVAGILRLRKNQPAEEQEDPWTRELLSIVAKNKAS